MSTRRAKQIEALMIERDMTLKQLVKARLVTKREAREWIKWDRETREGA